MEPWIHSITPGDEPDLDTTHAGNAKTDVSEAGSSSHSASQTVLLSWEDG